VADLKNKIVLRRRKLAAVRWILFKVMIIHSPRMGGILIAHIIFVYTKQAPRCDMLIGMYDVIIQKELPWASD